MAGKYNNIQAKIQAAQKWQIPRIQHNNNKDLQNFKMPFRNINSRDIINQTRVILISHMTGWNYICK